MKNAKRTILGLLMAVVLLVPPGLLNAAALSGPTLDPADETRLIGGELLAYQFDSDDLGLESWNSVRDHSPFEATAFRNGVSTTTSKPGLDQAVRGAERWDRYAGTTEVGHLSAATEAFTVGVWMLSHHNGVGNLFHLRSADGATIMKFEMDCCLSTHPGEFHIVMRFHHVGGKTYNTLYTGLWVPFDEWHHLAFTFEDGAIRLYRDAQLVQTLNVGWAHLYQGSPPASAQMANSLDGMLDEVRVYDRALSASEIDEIAKRPYWHENLAPVAAATAPATVPCEDGVGHVQLDASGSSDPEGDALSFQWDAPTAASLQDATSAVATATFPYGSHTAAVTVTDGEDADTASLSVEVVDTEPPTIEQVTPSAPGFYAGEHAVDLPDGGILVVGGTDFAAEPGPDCSGIQEVRFALDDGTTHVDTQEPYEFPYTATGEPVQERTLTVTAVDTAGHVSEPVEVAFRAFAAP